ncbi:(R)-mandelonitrile lyase [Pontivivens insulae]|uniref:Cupin type-2 domain-containing protein n=1 Tax=Pontivivens insulae TaxID=1639689 RepID=A0A2R8AEV8_9RHOB|nr:cupin domain-containing protein [Pontivivens insulae]RED11970.1 quercetin dioxygenase-like cupin family protein [Pontivivens insulae]SPF30726.1 hypothetical protein POI8812_03068 [Pontivivens insulae]
MSLTIHRNGDRPTRSAPEKWFTGQVWMTPIIETPAPAALRTLSVTFTPGARTAWHTHPLGQTLYVTAGQGLVALEGEAPQVIRPGDTVYIAPGIRHWHGAGPDTSMTHIAMQEERDGESTDWEEHVSDADYGRQPA